MTVYARSTMPYKYVWVSDAAGECATLLFYVMTGLYFRPHAENPYFALQDDEISMAVRTEWLHDGDAACKL